MPLTATEAIAAAFRELPIFNLVQDLVSQLPPADQRKAVDYAPFIGASAGTPVYKILAEVDDPVHEFSDVIDMLSLDPASPLGLQLEAIDQLITDIKD